MSWGFKTKQVPKPVKGYARIVGVRKRVENAEVKNSSKVGFPTKYSIAGAVPTGVSQGMDWNYKRFLGPDQCYWLLFSAAFLQGSVYFLARGATAFLFGK